MWDAETKLYYWADISSQRKVYIKNLLDDFEVPNEGFAIIFDKNDYPNYENPIWQKQGLHMNIQLGGIEEMSPEPIFNILDSQNFANLIWISNRICSGDNVQFVWILTHELQHFSQDRICHMLSVANNFLFNNISHDSINIDEPKVAMTIPYEFDAELSAFKRVADIFGNIEADKFIKRQQNNAGLKQLLDYDLLKPYDVINHTISFFEKYQIVLENYVQSASDPSIRSFNISNTIKELRECF